MSGGREGAGGSARGAVRLLAAAFLLSGCAGLIHEVVWVRLLGHLFGVTAFAVSTVLAAYMGGLALGALLTGRLSARLRDPARVYALLEGAIGLFALAVPALLAGVQPLYGWLWREFHLSFAAFSALRFVLAGGLLLIPTLMMGATLPLLTEHFARRAARDAPPEWLYMVNLAGAVLGVALGGFALLPLAGIRGTILAGAALNLAAGLIVLAGSPPSPRIDAARTNGGLAAASATGPGRLLLATAFISGLTCLAGQVAWTRLASLLIGSTTYAFSAVLLAFLLSLAAGSFWIARGPARRPLADRLAIGFIGSAAALLLSVALVNRWPAAYWALFGAARPEGIVSAVAINAAAILAILAPPLVLAGTLFPLALAGAVSPGGSGTGAAGAGRAIGQLCAVNTGGAILGATLGGFVLVPWLGSHLTLVGIAAVLALFALACLGPAPGRRRVLAIAGSAGAVLAGAALVPEWDQKTLNAAIYEPQAGLDPASKNPKDRVLLHEEGPTATVMVLERPPRTRYMRINGRVNASNLPRDVATNVLLAQIPILLAPRAEEVMVVGLGSGVTAGAALQSPARRVTVVELEPAVVRASRLFDPESHAPLGDPRLRLLEDDARHILVASEDRYDVIISEPSHPWVSGVANLFTRDFFALAARRLEGSGLFAQWLQTYQISDATFRSILATFQSVFPQVMVFRSVGSDMILVGSPGPLSIDLEALGRRWRAPLAREEMRRIGFPGPESLLAHFAAGPDDVRAIAAGAPINTDDNMWVEFRAPADILRPADEERSAIAAALVQSPVESVLSDPAALLGSRERLRALVEALAARDRPAARYQQLLAGP